MVEVPTPEAVVADDRWELVESAEEQLGGGRLVTVDADRRLYGDRDLRERVRAATGIDRLWRSFFVSLLTTSPPLTPGIADLVVRTIAEPQARKRFVADLEARGFRSVRRSETTRIRVGGDRRARVTRFSTAIPLDDPDAASESRAAEAADAVAADALLAVWGREADVLAAGGIYPTGSLPGADGADLFAAPGVYREQLLDLLRSVG